ncbi:MAG: chemotaxis protein CheA [Bacteroidota bacterium]
MEDFSAMFREEAFEYLQTLEAALLRLDQTPTDREALDEAYRVLHTLKGTGQMFGFDALGAFAHDLENLFQAVRGGQRSVDRQMLDLSFQGLDVMRAFIAAENVAEEPSDAAESVLATISELLEESTDGINIVLDEPEPQEQLAEGDSFVEAGMQHTRIRVGVDKLDSQLNLVSELVSLQARLHMLAQKSANPELLATVEAHEKLTQSLRENAHEMRLVPIENLFQRAQRLVRDLSVSLDKPVDFQTIGGDTELDLAMLERLTDPLLHLLRNAMDHGIEPVDARKAAGKPERGSLQLIAQQVGTEVQLYLEDDGRGLDPDRLWQKGLERGLVSAPEPPSDEAAFELIFHPGFSTASKVTGISGRGMGMDVVRRSIRELNGEVHLYSVPGRSTAFKMHLPLTLSIMEGFLVQVANTSVVLPLAQVERCHAVQQSALQNPLAKLVQLDDERLPFLDLADAFSREQHLKAHQPPELRQAVVVNYRNEHRVALIVDRILGDQQAVLKSPGPLLRENQLLSGFSLLGNGEPAVVLDPQRVISQLLEIEELKAR